MQSSLQHIVTDKEIAFGRPRIAGTRITVKDVVIKHLRNGMELELIAGDFDLSLADVYAAMTYYYDHKTEIDQGIDDDARFVAEFRKQYEATDNRKYVA